MGAAFLLSFGVIFIAELGDKSQLMALAFATRYPALTGSVGITVATGLVHASVCPGRRSARSRHPHDRDHPRGSSSASWHSGSGPCGATSSARTTRHAS